MSGKILVIDDEPLILMTIGKALTRVGYDVKTTADSEEFLATLKRDGADLLIVDLHIGKVDTEALIAKAREIAPGAKLLIVSGSASEFRWEHYLQKPFKIADLRKKVQELLSEPQPT